MTKNEELENEIGELETETELQDQVIPDKKSKRILDIVKQAGKEISYDEALQRLNEIKKETEE